MSTARLARDSVISTPELLELTLTHLPMRDLLVTAPLVSRTWRALTLTPTLQRALFFQPAPFSAPVINPLLAEIFPPFFVPDQDPWSRSRAPRSWPGTADSIMSMPWDKAPEAFRRTEANWRRMLVTQPPAQKIIFLQIQWEWDYARTLTGIGSRRAVLKNTGLRMGALYDLVLSFVDSNHSLCSFCINWHNAYGNSDSELEGGLTFAVSDFGWYEGVAIYDERFYSDAPKATVYINFREWVFTGDN